jgi:hypothetical protein
VGHVLAKIQLLVPLRTADDLAGQLHRYEAAEACAACRLTRQGLAGMGEALYEAYRVPKARQIFGRSLRRTPQTNSSPTCTGTRLPKAALHAR